MRFVISVAAALFSAACTISAPVTGRLADGQALQGQVSASSSGDGVFWVAAPGGFRCDGRYDPFEKAPSFIVPVKCADGRTGELVVTRRPDMVSGTAVGKLSDGMEGRFAFGNFRVEQAFPGWPPQRVSPPVIIVQRPQPKVYLVPVPISPPSAPPRRAPVDRKPSGVDI